MPANPHNVGIEIAHLLILAQIERAKRAAVALLDADDDEFNQPFGAACDLDAALLGVPSARPEAKQAEGAR